MTAPTNVTFTSGTTITSEWLNGVNDYVNELDPADHSSANVTYSPPFTNSNISNVETKLSEWVSPQDFGAIGDGITNDITALTTAETQLPANLFNGCNSTYKITSNLPAGFRMINGEIYDTRTVNPTDPYSVVGIGQNVLTANTFIPEQHSSSYPAPYTNWASGNHLVAIGYNALAANTTGRRNTAIGSQTMTASTTAYYNTAVGSHSLQKLTTGHENVAIGVQALNSVTSGTGNTGLGTTAGTNITTGTNNSFGGNLAGTYCTTGNSNTGFGYRAGFSITTADDVTAFGRDSLVSCTTGIQNTAVGAAAAQNVVTSQNNTVMGWSALRNADSNYNSAFGALSLYAATSGDKNTAVGNYSGWELTTGSNNLLLGYYAGGSSSPSGSLTTQSNRICLGDNNITNAYINVSWTVVSDERDKTEIKDIPYGLDFVSKLKPIQYKLDNRSRYWIQNEDGTVDKSVISDGSKADEKPSFGFKAQDIIALEKEINGNCVIGDDSDDELLKVTDARFIPVLVKAIQELKAEFDAYKLLHP